MKFENRDLKMAMLFAISILYSAFCLSAGAAALSANRDTPELKPANLVWLTQGSNVIYAGSIVAVNSSGVACPAADATGYDVVGRAEAYSDNSGSTYSSAKTIAVKRGIFKWANGDSITDADIGSLVYVTDDQTVQKGASTYNIIAGVVVKYESTGVWVDTHDIGAQGAITPASMAVAGNGTIGGTLGVTGNSTLSGNVNIAGTLTNTGAARMLGALTVDGAVILTNAVTLSAPAGVGTYTNAATGFTNVFDAGGRLLSHDP